MKPETLETRLLNRIDRKRGDVFLRADFEDLGGYDQVGRVLRKIVREGRLVRVGQGLRHRLDFGGRQGRRRGLRRASPPGAGSSGIRPAAVRFVADSLLEGSGFEPSVPRHGSRDFCHSAKRQGRDNWGDAPPNRLSFCGGTESSNPLPSTGESANFQSLSVMTPSLAVRARCPARTERAHIARRQHVDRHPRGVGKLHRFGLGLLAEGIDSGPLAMAAALTRLDGERPLPVQTPGHSVLPSAPEAIDNSIA
jgi:hypothetical protein